MLSRLAKAALVSTAFAPILLTLAVVRFTKDKFWPDGACYLTAAIIMTLLCVLLLHAAKTRLESMPFKVKSIKTADKEVLAFVLAYLLPFASGGRPVEPAVLWFVFILLLVVVWTSHSYHFNPLLGLLGYHFYEVTSDGNVTFVLVTDRTLRDCAKTHSVVQLTDYIVLDSGK